MDKKFSKLGKGVNFERIRRITGYLVGSLSTWNNAKRAEERDRVKHMVPGSAILALQEASQRICKDDYDEMMTAFILYGQGVSSDESQGIH